MIILTKPVFPTPDAPRTTTLTCFACATAISSMWPVVAGRRNRRCRFVVVEVFSL